MPTFSVKINSLQDLERFAELLTDSIDGTEVILCKGDLGTGKTSLAKLLLKKLGVREEVTSPTFNIQLQYQSSIGVCSHFDLYRVEEVEEIDELGLFEQIGENLLFIEWPEIIEAELKTPDFQIEIRHTDDGERLLHIHTEKWLFQELDLGKEKIIRSNQ